MGFVDAPDVVRQLVLLASELLREDWKQFPPSTTPTSRLERVALLRDELHVVANRVSRFGDDEHPVLDVVRITAPTPSSAALASTHLLFQLDLAAERLIAYLDALSPGDWMRAGRVGDQLVTLGEFVERVLHSDVHDLLELLHDAPVAPPEEVVPDYEERTRGAWIGLRRRRCSPLGEVVEHDSVSTRSFTGGGRQDAASRSRRMLGR